MTSAPGPDGPFLRRRSNNLPPEEIKQGRTDHFCAHFTTFVFEYNLQAFYQKSNWSHLLGARHKVHSNHFSEQNCLSCTGFQPSWCPLTYSLIFSSVCQIFFLQNFKSRWFLFKNFKFPPFPLSKYPKSRKGMGSSDQFFPIGQVITPLLTPPSANPQL